MTAIYIGCGMDILPIKLFENVIDNFVCIDKKNDLEFIGEFIKKVYELGYKLKTLYDVNTTETIHLSFWKGYKSIDCYFNTLFPQLPENCFKEICMKLVKAKYLVVSDYHPHKVILSVLTNFTVLSHESGTYIETLGKNVNIKNVISYGEKRMKIL